MNAKSKIGYDVSHFEKTCLFTEKMHIVLPETCLKANGSLEHRKRNYILKHMEILRLTTIAVSTQPQVKNSLQRPGLHKRLFGVSEDKTSNTR